MKVLFTGGVKSGKSKASELKALHLAQQLSPLKKLLYLATSEPFDDEMQQKAARHKEQRCELFETMEEPLNLQRLQDVPNSVVLIECMTVWLNNMLYYNRSEEMIFDEATVLLGLSKEIVFVINDIGSGVIAADAPTRRFIELNGMLAQLLATGCDEVHHCIAGIPVRIK